MKKSMRFLWTGLLVIVLLAGCQAASATGGTASTGNFSAQGGQPPADMQTQIASNPELATRMASGGGPGGAGGPGGFGATTTATAIATVEPTATPEPTATAVDPTSGAVQTAQGYFTAIETGDFSTASKLVSSFSLLANKLTAGDVVEALTQQKTAGAAWSNFKVAGSQVFDTQTILVHVTYTFSSTDAKSGKTVETTMDEQWPFRLEQKKWKYNWTNIIDFETLGSNAKLSNGLTVKPLQMARYTDKIRLTVMAQNNTVEAISVGGTTNQRLGTFHFGSQTVEAENTHYLFDAYRTYMSITIDVKGLYTSYPDAVELIRYGVTGTATPWFTFALND
jgi:hypothetical protein